MFKRLGLVFAFLILVSILIPPLSNYNGAVISERQKSSGEFLTVKSDNYFNLIGASGITVYKNADFNYQEFIDSLGAKFIHSFSDGETLNLYFYSEKLLKKEVVFNKKVNVHIAVNKEQMVIGYPFIYYGY